MILSNNSARKPFITLITMISAATPEHHRAQADRGDQEDEPLALARQQIAPRDHPLVAIEDHDCPCPQGPGPFARERSRGAPPRPMAGSERPALRHAGRLATCRIARGRLAGSSRQPRQRAFERQFLALAGRRGASARPRPSPAPWGRRSAARAGRSGPWSRTWRRRARRDRRRASRPRPRRAAHRSRRRRRRRRRSSARMLIRPTWNGATALGPDDPGSRHGSPR